MDPRRSRRLARVLVLLGACAAVITAAAQPSSAHGSVRAEAGHPAATHSPNDWWW